jgi:predicted DNA-binding transcriptional regulator AlpA
MTKKCVAKKRRGQRRGSMHIDRRAARLLEDPVSEGSDDEILDTRQLAEWLGVSVQWAEIARLKGTGPRFVSISPRRIGYRRGDVRAWLRKRSHQCTAEYTGRAT